VFVYPINQTVQQPLRSLRALVMSCDVINISSIGHGLFETVSGRHPKFRTNLVTGGTERLRKLELVALAVCSWPKKRTYERVRHHHRGGLRQPRFRGLSKPRSTTNSAQPVNKRRRILTPKRFSSPMAAPQQLPNYRAAWRGRHSVERLVR